jgi:hypothetical protein
MNAIVELSTKGIRNENIISCEEITRESQFSSIFLAITWSSSGMF